MEHVFSDLKFVVRNLRRSPLFVVVAVASLALGIGASSAIFSLLDQVLWRSLPVEEPKQLVSLDWDGAFSGFVWGDHVFSYPTYCELRDASGDVLTGMAARFGSKVDIGWKGAAEQTNAELVSGTYFPVLGVRPAIGRLLTPSEDRKRNGEPYVVLSYGYWQQRFGGKPDVLNRTVLVNNHSMTVIGVTERGFRGTDASVRADVFVPMAMKRIVTPSWDRMDERRAAWLNIFGRLKPGVTLTQAQAALTPVFRQSQKQDLATNSEAPERFRKEYLQNKFFLTPAANGFSGLRQQFSTPLLVLMAMVCTLLLIACGNVANLLVVRAASRQKEIAVRLSVGATKLAIFRLVMVESLLLSIVGGVFGVLVASWSGSLLLSLLPFESLEQVISTAPDGRMLLFTFAVSVATAFIFGLTPAIQIAKPDLAETLKTEARSLTGAGGARLRKAMVVSQISLSLLLLIGAGLFSRSLMKLMQTRPGIRTHNLLSFSVDPSLAGYPEARARQVFRELQGKLAGVPGVLRVSASDNPILADNRNMATTRTDAPPPNERSRRNSDVSSVLPGFFNTVGIRLVAGRDFSEADVFGAPKVAIVNETFVRTRLQGRNAIGRRIGFGSPEHAKLDMEVVGVVKDAKIQNLKTAIHEQVWIPELQNASPSSVTFYLETAVDSKALVNLVRQIVREQDVNLPVYDMKTVAKQIDETHYVDRLISMLSAVFGIVATALAAAGLYGVTAFSVTKRAPELGIRIALGARRVQVLKLVMTEVVLLAGIGIAAALPLAYSLGKLVEKQLFEIKAHDAVTTVVACALLAGITLLAGFIPAQRATRIDPMKTLRWD